MHSPLRADVVERLLGKDEAAAVLGVSVRTLDRETAPRGPLPCVRIGTRIQYDPADLRAFIDSRRILSNPGAPSAVEVTA